MIFFSFSQVNLLTGQPSKFYRDSCTAGAGTLLLEFGVLSRLLEDPTFENHARRAVAALWRHRSTKTGLFGTFVFLKVTVVIGGGGGGGWC